MLDILIPVHEESENIDGLINKIKKFVNSEHKIYFIYDKKSDPTVTMIKNMNTVYKNIYLVQNIYKKGFLNAIKTGIMKSKSDIICIMMGDLSDDPRDIDKMYKKINSGYDLVCASRYMKGGKKQGGPFIKNLLSRFACLSLKKITDITTSDATNAFKMFRRTILREITIESSRGFEFPLELSVKAYLNNRKIIDIPTTWRDRGRGNSKFKIFEMVPYYIKWYLYCVQKKYLF